MLKVPTHQLVRFTRATRMPGGIADVGAELTLPYAMATELRSSRKVEFVGEPEHQARVAAGPAGSLAASAATSVPGALAATEQPARAPRGGSQSAVPKA